MNDNERQLDHRETQSEPRGIIQRVLPRNPSVITPKAANSYQFKSGHSTSVRDKSFYSFGVRSGKDVLLLRVSKCV
jgi:hypothetical protein